MSCARYYPEVARRSQSFKGQKVNTVPSQAMSLQDIIKRFIRKESLPIEKQGFYEERLGDLEKIAREDMTERADRLRYVKDMVKRYQKEEDVRQKKKKDEEAAAAAAKVPPPVVPLVPPVV